jgi:hypothetical protein
VYLELFIDGSFVTAAEADGLIIATPRWGPCADCSRHGGLPASGHNQLSYSDGLRLYKSFPSQPGSSSIVLHAMLCTVWVQLVLLTHQGAASLYVQWVHCLLHVCWRLHGCALSALHPGHTSQPTQPVIQAAHHTRWATAAGCVGSCQHQLAQPE